MAQREATDRSWKSFFPRQIRDLPADLAFVVVVLVATNAAVFLPWISESPVRLALGLPLVLFLPGYAVVATLFPEEGESPVTADEDSNSTSGRAGIDGIERIALSFGLSIAVVPLVGLVLNFTPWGIQLVPIMVSLSGLTLGLIALAAKRRWALAETERFTVPYRTWLADGRQEMFEPDTRADAALNVLLATSVLLAVGSVGYAVAVPEQGGAFTEFYLLTETDDGDLVADDYPTTLTVGESEPLVIGIGNQEHESREYTVVAELQQVTVENNRTIVESEQQVGQFQSPTLEHNETWHHRYEIQPPTTGERLRLVFLLYNGTAPSDPSITNAYRETHLWVNVSR